MFNTPSFSYSSGLAGQLSDSLVDMNAAGQQGGGFSMGGIGQSFGGVMQTLAQGAMNGRQGANALTSQQVMGAMQIQGPQAAVPMLGQMMGSRFLPSMFFKFAGLFSFFSGLRGLFGLLHETKADAAATPAFDPSSLDYHQTMGKFENYPLPVNFGDTSYRAGDLRSQPLTTQNLSGGFYPDPS